MYPRNVRIFSKSTLRYNPEAQHPHLHHYENLKSHIVNRYDYISDKVMNEFTLYDYGNQVKKGRLG
jgi:hypothetical protein